MLLSSLQPPVPTLLSVREGISTGWDSGSLGPLGQWHTHQMPTSLLLLRIQVSAALNLEEGLLVTFCGVEYGGELCPGAAARTSLCVLCLPCMHTSTPC